MRTGLAERETSDEARMQRSEKRFFTPRADIIDLADAQQIVLDIPGATSDDIDIQLERGVMTIEADAPQRYGDARRWLRREYAVGAFRRSFRVGDGFDLAKIEAKLENGVLTVRVPKAAQVRPRKVEVKPAG